MALPSARGEVADEALTDAFGVGEGHGAGLERGGEDEGTVVGFECEGTGECAWEVELGVAVCFAEPDLDGDILIGVLRVRLVEEF